MMKCVMCDNPKPLSKKIITKKYKECGLENVILVGVTSYHCPRCGEDYYKYHHIERLHQLIAENLVLKNGPLTGKQLRFLRTHLGLSTDRLAQLTQTTRETISRFENDKLPASTLFDRFLRSLVASSLPDRRYDLHDLWLNQTGRPSKSLKFRPTKRGWDLKVVA